MTKISWTCTQCGLWHSVPDDFHICSEFVTYDGIEFGDKALAAVVMMMQSRISPELLVRVESTPMNNKISWLTTEQKASKNLRMLFLKVVDGQEFPLFCVACGHDSSDELTVVKKKAVMVNIERKRK